MCFDRNSAKEIKTCHKKHIEEKRNGAKAEKVGEAKQLPPQDATTKAIAAFVEATDSISTVALVPIQTRNWSIMSDSLQKMNI